MAVLVIAMLLPMAGLAHAATTNSPERVALWPEQAPIGGGEFETTNVFITVHRPAKADGAAAIICPGGGYGGLVK